MMILNEIYKRLELTDDCLVRLSDPNWKNKVSFPSRIYRLLETNDLLKDMDAFFYFDNKPLILFFNGTKDKQALHRATWNFNESPIVIIVENNAVLFLPSTLKHIGNSAFAYCSGFFGKLILPDNLEYVGSSAFFRCSGLSGDLQIPHKITSILSGTFQECYLGGRLLLHNAITIIEDSAFDRNNFNGELVLPTHLIKIGGGAFGGNNFSGTLNS